MAEGRVSFPAATAPIIADPSSTGSVVSGIETDLPQASATICRTRRALRRPAADDDGLEAVSRAFERLDDVGDPIGEPAEAGDIELFEARRVIAEVESDDAAARGGVGGRGAATDERGQRMKPFRDQRRLGKPPGARDDATSPAHRAWPATPP